MFSYITTHAAAKANRVIIMAHRSEIVAQISEALDVMGVRHGRIQPGHNMTDDLVHAGMVQTVARRIDLIPAPRFLIIDEAHHAISKSYRDIVSAWPDAKILGVTATPQRLDGRGLGAIFDHMVLGPTPAELIAGGWLAPYTYLAPPSRVDLSGVGKIAGDYITDQLAAAMDRPTITGDAVTHYQQHLPGRPAIAFCVTVEHAEHVAAQFAAAGISAASVDGTMDRATRRDRIQGLAGGKYRVLTSCALISEGLDVPAVAGVIQLRPTQSLSMFLQQIGRAMRPKADRSHAVILDHVGNVGRHGLPDAARNWSLTDKQKKKAHPTQQCDVCFRVFAAGPGWKAAALAETECEEPTDPDCVLRAESQSAPPAPPKQVDGALQVVTSTPEWTGGCDILSAGGPEWRALLARADTREKLDQIRRARGYKPQWVHFIMSGRARG